MPRLAKSHAIMEQPEVMSEVRPEHLRLLEALLFASAEPLDEGTLASRLPEGIDVGAALARLQQDYAARGVNLVRAAGRLVEGCIP